MKPSIEELVKALQNSWSGETSFDATAWNENNPARGQCVVSSLVVQKYLGGDLLRYRVTGDGFKETHYCNVLIDGTVLDTTATQYKEPVTFEVVPVNLKGFDTVREKRLAEDETRSRYEVLLHRVESRLEQAA